TTGALSQEYHASFFPALDIPKCRILQVRTLPGIHFKPGSGSRIPQTIATILPPLDHLEIGLTYEPDGGISLQGSHEGSGGEIEMIEGQISITPEESRKPVVDFLLANINPSTSVELDIDHWEDWSDEALTSWGDLIGGLPGLQTVRLHSRAPELA